MQQPHKFLLIDGMSFLFRAYYASAWSGGIRQTSAGVYTNAVYGFTKLMLDYCELVNPSHLIVAWDVDSRETLVRSKWYDGYKANRTEPPEELVPQFELVKQLMEAFSIPNLGLSGYEGDDILGTLSTRFSAEGHEVIIATGDYDSLQLVNEQVHVKVLKNGGKHEHYTPGNLLELRGITAEQVIDVKALQGDSSDCIPGCPGIGEKTAVKLINQYGSLDQLYQQLDTLTTKTREKLLAHRDQVYLSRKLATILCDLPVNVEIEESVWSFDRPRVEQLFDQLEFGKTMLSRLDRFS